MSQATNGHGDRGRADAQQQAPVEQAGAQYRLPQRGAEQHHEEAGEAIFAEQAETDDRPEQDVVDAPAPLGDTA
jgi:hypothetical protein